MNSCMFLINFIIGYFSMSIMISKNFTNNLNKLYIALFMTLLMTIGESFMMNSYNINLLIILLLSFIFAYLIREQIFINDKQFLKSMIEHHQMAIVMSQKLKYKTKNQQLLQLLNNIENTQEKEIKEMKNMLN